MTSASQVFGTIELLEAILFKLPPKDLLFAQRVSRTWKQTIDGSTKLQQALFFKAIPGGLLNLTEAAGKGQKVLKNPFLDPLVKLLDGMDTVSETVEELLSTLYSDATGRALPIALAAWHMPNATWRSMLPTQPPTVELYRVVSVVDHPRHGLKVKDGVSSRYAINMGKLVEEIDEMIERFDKGNADTDVQSLGVEKLQSLRSNFELEGLIRNAGQDDPKQLGDTSIQWQGNGTNGAVDPKYDEDTDTEEEDDDEDYFDDEDLEPDLS